MSAATRYSSGLFAPVPSPGYPGGNFFGSVPTTASTAAPGRNAGPMGSVAGAVNGALPSSLSGHHAIAIGVVVLGGFLIYYFARKE